VVEADRLMSLGMWDQAIALYDQVLARDPQNERAARGRANAIGARELRRQRAARGGRDPSPAPQARPEDVARQQAELADAAEGALAHIGEPAVAMLVQALQDGNPHRRRRAANALGGIGVRAESAVPALNVALQDPAVREAAARALVRIAPHSAEKYLPVLGAGIDDRDADAARRSVAALSQLRTPDAVPALIQALDDDRTRDTALFGLRGMGPRAAAAVPALVQVLQDPREAHRGAAAQALGEIGMAAAAAIPALTDVVGKDPNGGVREAAARALGAMGPASSAAVPVLIDNLRYGDGGYRVATGAVIALKQIGLPAVPALTAALKCNRLPPAAPMARTGYQGAVYPETENVRVYAAHALSGIGREASAAIPALRESLQDPSPRVREAAAGALREIERN
jgi:HEAT repeat protein